MTGGYSDSYQQTDQTGGQGAYDPTAGYSPAATYQEPAAAPYDPSPDTSYTTARVPKERSFSMEGVGRGIVLLLIIVGIVLILVAKVMAAQLITIDYNPFDDDADEVEQQIEDIQYNSTVLSAVAIALISMGLMMAAVMLEGLGTSVRSGLAIAAGIIIGLTGFLPIIS